MSHDLSCRFFVGPGKGLAYWWPLIFETLWEESFHFSIPEALPGIGQYTYISSVNPWKSHNVVGPFRPLWEKIYEIEASIPMVSLWTWGIDPLYLDVILANEQEPGEAPGVQMSIFFAGAHVMEEPPEEARARMGKVFDCLKRLAEVCRPVNGEVYWEYAGVAFAPWATFNRPPERPSEERPVLPGPHRELVQLLLADGSQVYLLDPVPIPRLRGEWEFISLLA